MKTEKFETSFNILRIRSSIPCETPIGEAGPNDDEFDEEVLQNHEFRGASEGQQTNTREIESKTKNNSNRKTNAIMTKRKPFLGFHNPTAKADAFKNTPEQNRFFDPSQILQNGLAKGG